MKTSLKLFALGMILMGYSVSANAQGQATATGLASATATVKATLGATGGDGGASGVTNTNLQFGTFAGSASVATTVIIDQAGARSGTADMFTSTTSAAVFNFTGEPNQGVTITLPADGIVSLKSSGKPDMAVTSFNSDHTGVASLGADGKLAVTVGATLNVGVGQAAGSYTSTFNVTAIYN